MKLFEWIAGLFSDIKRIFKSIPQEVAEHATESLQLTKWLRAALDNPITRAVLNTIPGAADDIAVAAAVNLIDKVIPYLEILNACKDITDPFERVACWANALAKLPKHSQDAYLHKLASLLTAEKDGNRLKQSLYDFYTQATYIAKYK